MKDTRDVQSAAPGQTPASGKTPIDKVMPWTFSGLLHGGVILLMMLVTMLTVSTSVEPDRPMGVAEGGSPIMKVEFFPPEKSKREIDDVPDMGRDDTIIGMDDDRPGPIPSPSFPDPTPPIPSIRSGPGLFTISPRHSDFDTATRPADNIVFVVDRSGSMTDRLQNVKYEIALAIGRLDPNQKFYIIFFAEDKPLESPGGLVACGQADMSAVVAFIDDVSAEGYTDPVPALRRTFEVLDAPGVRGGKLIHLLTDAEFADSRAVLEQVERLNVEKKVQINTYLYEDRTPQAEKVMKQLAERNGGLYNYVNSVGE